VKPDPVIIAINRYRAARAEVDKIAVREPMLPNRAYFEAARRLKGETIPMHVPSESRGIFNKLFGRKAA
jgi:septum formation inhibitor-activating ATPase MinD